ncbi:sodium-coupled monocarboxylate transporter 2-like isoform X1 [Homalodisca vitripennis]|uniref:sodium-coupled monocarboxylate transporter 2-like isoform X1 n=3 Tax=Homalodisca vitripennis TaxID=197043 RepID=UPI001EEA4839|nr:sodium-coupled monocarboxylate transporter 2-like isoform X1 [Homalodisca vitripennis]
MSKSATFEMDVINSTVSTLTSGHSHFGLVEYSIFASLLALSALIGLYIGCFQRQNTVSDYLLGGKKMGIIPVALSNVASHVSGITLLGVPAEIYLFGTQYYVIAFSIIGVTFMIIYCYLPVFHPLQLNSAFQYLEMRFNSKVRTLGSFIFAVSLIVYIPIVIYVPSLAFNQVTGASVHVIAPIICIVCIFYTTLGGLKAVVWTDALQSVFIAVSIISVTILGVRDVGGFNEVFRIAEAGHRLELFNFNPDPLARNTFWTVFAGTHFFWLSNFAVNPGATQKFICVPTLRGAKIVMMITCVCIIGVTSLTSFIGLLMYAKYHDCDPITSKVIEKSGQMLPYYVMEVAKNVPGLSGLFISGVVSAALSTMSASLNTVAGTLYEDFVAPFYKKSPKSDATASLVMKAIVLVVGTCCVLLIFIVEKLGGIMQMAISVTSITHGAMIYIFSVGIFFPWVNSKGALWGAVASLVSMTWVVAGSQYYMVAGQLQFPSKILSVDQCLVGSNVLNTTVASSYAGIGSPVIAEGVPPLYQLSYMYFSGLGALVGLLVGLTVTCLTQSQPLELLDPRLITPCMRRFLPAPAPAPEELKLIQEKNSVKIVINGV